MRGTQSSVGSVGRLLLSASQINVYRECKRKWAFQYIAGIRTPSTASQALGTDVDDNYLQPYLREGIDFNLNTTAGRIAASGKWMLPPEGSAGKEGPCAVQRRFQMPSPSKKFDYQGFIDLWDPSRLSPLGPSGLELPIKWRDILIPIIGDFKTTKSRQYAKSAAELEVDVQAQLYAVWGMWSTKCRVVDLNWMYFETTNPRKDGSYWTDHTVVRVEAEHVAKQFRAIDKTGQEIHQEYERAGGKQPEAIGIEYALSLEPNPAACDMFGGCPHRHRCNLSPVQEIAAIAAIAAMTPSTSHAVVYQTIGDVPDMPDVTSESLMAGLAARKAKKAGTVPAAVSAPPAATLAPVHTELPAAQNPNAVQVNPPEQHLAPADPVGGEFKEAAPKKSRGRPRKTATAPVDTTPEATADMAPVTSSPPVQGLHTTPAPAARDDSPPTTTAIGCIAVELKRARGMYPPFNSFHEGYSTILEELDELWDEVKKKPDARDLKKLRVEAVQVAAMAARFAEDLCGGPYDV